MSHVSRRVYSQANVSLAMTNYSQLPHLNPVAPQHEEPLFGLPAWRAIGRGLMVLVSWFNFVLISLILWGAYSGLAHPRRCTFPFHSQWTPLTEIAPFLIAVNLCCWSHLETRCSRFRWLAKVPALLAIILWCSVGGGILLGRLLPIDSDPQPTPHHYCRL